MLAHQDQVVDLANLQFIHLQVPWYTDTKDWRTILWATWGLHITRTIAIKCFGIQKRGYLQGLVTISTRQSSRHIQE
jgi:hypothetical protein